NQKDLAEIPSNVKKGLKIIPVKTVEEVINAALEKKVKRIIWQGKGKQDVKDGPKDDDDDKARAH
ncbi:MAG: hypothetical protein K2X53_03325, partial [Alphaproteobacteria bacterium]|nr:hypothetical protein [Alphaproteobacteria bacterium]